MHLSLSSFRRQLKTHMAHAALVYVLVAVVCLVYITSSGAVVTVFVSSAPTTNVPTQLNSTQLLCDYLPIATVHYHFLLVFHSDLTSK